VIELSSVLARALYAAGMLIVFGTLLCLHLPPRAPRNALLAWRTRWLRLALVLAAATLLLGAAVLMVQAIGMQSEASRVSVATRLLTQTRFGAVWLAREAAMLAACLLLALAIARPGARIAPTAALLTSSAALALAPLSGHSAALEPAWPVLSAHMAHLLAGGAWWGALPALAALLALAARGDVAPSLAAATLRRFSALALWLIVVVVASGVALAITHVESWPALLATRYGTLLTAKVLVLAGVLTLAAKLRRELLPALQAQCSEPRRSEAIARRCARWIAAECLVAGLIVVLAVQLAQSVPARHDAIVWWLPLRLSVEATWDTAWTPIKVWSSAALLALALVLAGLALRERVRGSKGFTEPAVPGLGASRRNLGTAALNYGAVVLTIGAAALALPALSVDAYPDTYRKPSVPYQTLSVASGAELFATHCSACHGRGGRGDGEQATRLALPPADLTAAHTALHTAGDIFWWLTHGKPPGVMPGFATQLDEDQCWDLINFLRTLSTGYQARILEPRIARRRPWLGAVDFAFVDQQARPAALKDYRGRSAVLLVLFTLPGSQARLAQLAHEHPRLRAAGVEIIAVPIAAASCPRQDCGDAVGSSSLPFAVVADGAAETARAYALLRRTLANPDPRDNSPPPHMEMLIDRFGYIRARWVAREGEGWQRLELLLEQLAALAREPQLRPPPEDHVH